MLLQYCIIPVLFLLLHLHASATAEPLAYTCDSGGRVVSSNYTANGTFGSNLSLLLASLSTTKSNFTTDSKGSVPGRAYGLILCRGDAKPPDCRACLRNAAQDVLALCPLSKQATIWYDNCELRYADLSFFSVMYEANYVPLISGNNATNMKLSAFVALESQLLDSVMSAAYNSSLMFATGIGGDGMKPKIYALAQCTRDLSADGCSRCLQQIRARYEEYPGNIYQEGGRVLGQSCNFRYESEPFFAAGKPTVSIGLPSAAVPMPAPRSPQPPPSTVPNVEGTKNETRRVLLIVIPVAVGIVTIFIIGICFWRRSKSAKNINGTIALGLENISNTEWLLFDLSMLKAATLNFADSKKLGQGGFGTVYKGTLPSGEDIAVKRLSVDSRQGIQELKNELVLVAKFQHRNLVRLRGVCLEEGEKLLVYEYVPNGSLDDFLFDPVRSKQLNWETRFKIIRGISRGLLYLHEESHIKVLHRDLKASNVLLDDDMSPKISDFGLARLFGEDETHGITSRVVGTFGYMAPEYARRGLFSMKLDVYSFGILVLEIVTGKRNNGFHYDSEISQDIVSYTWEPWKNGTALEIVDPSMGEIFSSNEVLTCIQIGLLCAQEVPANRPSMSSVVHMLHGPLMPLEEPLQPIVIDRNRFVDSSVSSKLSDLNSSEEFARTLYSTHEDGLLIKHKSMSSTTRTEWNLVSNRADDVNRRV